MQFLTMIFDHFEQTNLSNTHFDEEQIGSCVITEQSDLNNASVVLIGIQDASHPKECNIIRKEIYSLYRLSVHQKIFDLGNFSLLDKEKFSYEQLADCLAMLLELHVLPIVFGGSQKTMFSLHQAFAKNKEYMNVGMIDKAFQFQEDDKDIPNDKNYLLKICKQQNGYLFNFIQMAYQTYLVSPQTREIQKELNFDEMRLGTIRDDIKEAEPLVRNLDLLGVSLQALKFSETGNQSQCEPNGLYSEELAQLMRYAGMSDKLRAIGFFDYQNQQNNLTGAKLIAQSIWCFLEGVLQRKREWPDKDGKNFMKYTIHNKELDLDLVFYKSEISGRWWVLMPKEKATLQRRFFIPCSYNDYQTALDGDIPERWLKGFQKLG